MTAMTVCSLRLALAAAVCLFIPAHVKACSGEDSDTTAFRNCLAGVGDYRSCSIPTGTHVINCPLVINNSSLLAIEGGDTDPYDTVLQRGFVPDAPPHEYGSCTTNTWPVMCYESAAQGLYVEYLTIDGNRWSFGSPPASGYSALPNATCLAPNVNGADLDLTEATIATVWYVNFIRAPDIGVLLGGSTYSPPSNPKSSTIDYSDFAESTASYATRSTAISSFGDYGGAYYNNISYAGTAAIDVSAGIGQSQGSPNGTNQVVYGNTIWSNRYEMSDGIQGGQVYVDPTASYESIVTNVIEGSYWYTTPYEVVNGCQVQSSGNETPYGIEAYGEYNYYYNNEVYDQAVTGVQVGDGDTLDNGHYDVTEGVYFSGSNPWDGSDTLHYIEGNSYLGIGFAGGASNPVTGVTLDGVRVCYTGEGENPERFTPLDGIYFTYTEGTGFINGATMSNNLQGNVGGSTSGLTNGPPASPTACP